MRCPWSPTAVSWWVCLCADCWSEEEVADISLSSVSSQEIRVDESLKIVCLHSELNKLKWQSRRMKTTLGLLYKQTIVLFFLVLFHNVRNWEFSLKNVTRSDWVTVFSSKPPVQFFPAKPPNRRKLRQNSTNQQVALRFFPSPIMKGESVMDEPSFKQLFIHLIFVNIHEIYSSRMTKKGMFAALSSHRRADGVGGATDCPAAAEGCDGWASSWFLMNTAAPRALPVNPAIEGGSGARDF